MIKKNIICIFIMFYFISYNFAQNNEIDKSQMGRINAVIYDTSGTPVADARLFIYKNDISEFHRPAEYISDKSGVTGEISIELLPDKYYVIARKKSIKDEIGPLIQGDYNGKYDKNPIELKPGEIIKIELKIEKITGDMIFSPLYPITSTTIEGILKDKNGPVKNAYAMAYKSKGKKGRPDYMSKPSDENGNFVIYFSLPGRYFIVGRVKNRKPSEGAPFGIYNEEGIDIKADEKIKDIEIILK